MRSLSARSLSVLGLSALAMATSAQATILTFDTAQINGAPILSNYGDRVGNPNFPQPAGYQYGGLNDPTPGIVVDYLGLLQISDDANRPYGNLQRVLYRVNQGPGTGTMIEIVLTCLDAGFKVRLNSFDLAARLDLTTTPIQQEDIPVRSILVLGDGGTTLFSKFFSNPADTGNAATSNPVTNPGTLIPGTNPLRRNTYDFGPNGLMAQIITIRIDVGQILTKMERIGIDNVNFSQVPAPGSAAALAGLGLLAARRRRAR